MVRITQLQQGEADMLGRVMWDAIHNGASRYTAPQRTAWLAQPPAGDAWGARLAAQQVWVARDAGAPVAFVTLGPSGYIDLAYVQARSQGKGMFRMLLAALEQAAGEQGVLRLWTHASLMAQPAFTACGFHVIAHETVARSGQTLARAQMEKMLT